MVRNSDPFTQPSVEEVLQRHDSVHRVPVYQPRTLSHCVSHSGTPASQMLPMNVSDTEADTLTRTLLFSTNAAGGGGGGGGSSSSSSSNRNSNSNNSSSSSSNFFKSDVRHRSHHHHDHIEGNRKLSLFSRFKNIFTPTRCAAMHKLEESAMRNEPYCEENPRRALGENENQLNESNKSEGDSRDSTDRDTRSNYHTMDTAEVFDVSNAARDKEKQAKSKRLKGSVAKTLAREETRERRQLQEDCLIVLADIGRTYRGMVRNTTGSGRNAKALRRSMKLLEKEAAKQIRAMKLEWKKEILVLHDVFRAEMVADAKRSEMAANSA